MRGIHIHKHACLLWCPQVTDHTCPHLESFLHSVPEDRAFAANLTRELGNFMSSPGASRVKVSGCLTFRPREAEGHGVCGGGIHWPVGGPGVSDLLWAVIFPRRSLLPVVEWARICPAQPGQFFPSPATKRSNASKGDRHSGWLYSTCPSLLPRPPPHSQPIGRTLL